MTDMSWLNDFDPTAAMAAVGDNNNKGDFEPLPEGSYDFEVVKHKVEAFESDKATGTKMEFELSCRTDGFANRRVWQRLFVNYVPKPGQDIDKAAKTQQIARAQYGSLCVAAGLSKGNDPELLHGKFVRAKVKIREYNGKRSNEVVGMFEAPKDSTNATRPMASNGGSFWMP
jgi:hypothetical protein